MANLEAMNAKRTRYLPEGAVKIASKVDNSVAYQYVSTNGKPGVLAFFGNRTKPFMYFWYETEAKRNAKITEFFETVTANQERKAATRKERAQPHNVKLGDIFSTSWGWDQTQVEFYQVVELKGKATVVVRELKAHVAAGSETTGDSNRVYAVKDDFSTVGTSKHRINMQGNYPTFTAAYNATASAWDGKPQHHSWGR